MIIISLSLSQDLCATFQMIPSHGFHLGTYVHHSICELSTEKQQLLQCSKPLELSRRTTSAWPDGRHLA